MKHEHQDSLLTHDACAWHKKSSKLILSSWYAVTEEVSRRISRGAYSQQWCGHVHRSEVCHSLPFVCNLHASYYRHDSAPKYCMWGPKTREIKGIKACLVQLGVVQENRHRIMDLRANTDHSQEHLATADACTQPWQLKLKVGSQVAAEARAAVKACSVTFGSMRWVKKQVW